MCCSGTLSGLVRSCKYCFSPVWREVVQLSCWIQSDCLFLPTFCFHSAAVLFIGFGDFAGMYNPLKKLTQPNFKFLSKVPSYKIKIYFFFFVNIMRFYFQFNFSLLLPAKDRLMQYLNFIMYILYCFREQSDFIFTVI